MVNFINFFTMNMLLNVLQMLSVDFLSVYHLPFDFLPWNPREHRRLMIGDLSDPPAAKEETSHTAPAPTQTPAPALLLRQK